MVSCEYVRCSEDLSDYEAAISALERLLFYNPETDASATFCECCISASALMKMRCIISRRHPPSPKSRSDRPHAYTSDAQKASRGAASMAFCRPVCAIRAMPLPAGRRSILSAPMCRSCAQRRKRLQAMPLLSYHLSHDYDFQNQHGDVLETRFYGYGTKRFCIQPNSISAMSRRGTTLRHSPAPKCRV